ncbi:GAF domain-containing protein [Desulfomicrobium sp. ZS1]|uniref:GAF domain-containing protein n=1 Tax=Desulfomicrobium sp. ZS1 TaxID=2952228 RepID=UPI0020B35481|nr:GAF domain-containing protein [Desulfomicrobium sp. ZS1]UTF50976.1 GAF domain-containing protein [Desulfomicrobium sp. ZS1]
MTMKYPSLDRLLESIGSVFDAYSVVLFCRNSAGTFDLTTSFSLGDSIRKGTKIEQGQGLVGWILKNNSPLVVEKFDEKNTFLGYYGAEQDEQIKVFVGCPLPGGRGALCMDSKKTYAFTSKDQRLLSLFAVVVAAIIDDVGEGGVSSREQALYRVLQQVYALREAHPKWTDFLNRYLALLAGASGYEYAFLVVSDEWGNNYLLEGSNKPFMSENVSARQSFSTGSGLLGWVFKKNQSVFFGDGKSELGRTPLFGRDIPGPVLNTLMAFPLKVHTRCRGVLVFGDRESRVISAEIKDFANMAADYLALFLENLYLRSKVRRFAPPSVTDPGDAPDFDNSDYHP